MEEVEHARGFRVKISVSDRALEQQARSKKQLQHFSW